MGLVGGFLISWVAVSVGARIISIYLAAAGSWLGPQLELTARTPSGGLTTRLGFPHSVMDGFKNVSQKYQVEAE